ncbi:hypothetical protein NAEGRDRAFT_78790 [Naegleria gruberi]|uniref:Uncharacterized protein n=1 Tax=Naegleria gruberi TaxID=5762 RepID=D2V6J7_NAEGR|nr:uncharacterized protein NAEGRDRAFT_78790 [Naegleria gruberi]EFC47588.1 hypothetical protein NAEGRDRAFT_78790 [Naegleria gruberi]|eukprot:XP_002680332.1 hypothetical protein NAEGRDRAFT_78790 [Naegleria gruberi strain NEG-M]
MALNHQPANPAMMGLPATTIVPTSNTSEQVDKNLHSYSFPNNSKINKTKKTLKRKQSIVTRDTMSVVSSNFAKSDKCENSKSSFGGSPNFSLLANTNEDDNQIIDECTMSELSNQSNTSSDSHASEQQNGAYVGRRYSFLDVDMESILKFKLN